MKSCVITTDQDVENGIKVWVSLIDEILFTLKNKSRIICKGVCTKFTELSDASDLQLLHLLPGVRLPLDKIITLKLLTLKQ